MSDNRVEKLIYWYPRFNGYFTVENYTIHPDRKKESEAELDIVAVRFPFSEEDPKDQSPKQSQRRAPEMKDCGQLQLLVHKPARP